VLALDSPGDTEHDKSPAIRNSFNPAAHVSRRPVPRFCPSQARSSLCMQLATRKLLRIWELAENSGSRHCDLREIFEICEGNLWKAAVQCGRMKPWCSVAPLSKGLELVADLECRTSARGDGHCNRKCHSTPETVGLSSELRGAQSPSSDDCLYNRRARRRAPDLAWPRLS
jgi:hypothetical protein